MNGYHFFYKTPLGQGAIVYGKNGIKRHILPLTDEKTIEKVLSSYDSSLREKSRLRSMLESYFVGKVIGNWKISLDTSGHSSFKLKVYESIAEIPYGEVRSYKEVAKDVGIPSGARAVGMAMRENRHPLLLPCHRVIASNGRLGGWSGPLGLKERLLSIEGHFVDEEMRIEQ